MEANWLEKELLDCSEILSNCGFRVRTIVCDNHPTNWSSFEKLLEHVNQNPDELYMLQKSRKIYLCYDAVHVIKNARNNLLKCKRFIFPPFGFSGFKDPINAPGGEIAWKTFHDVFGRDPNLHANLRKAPKLTTKVLHPDNCKQNVPNALAIFDETTIAAVKSYFPEKASAAAFLTLFSKWWVLSNYRARVFNCKLSTKCSCNWRSQTIVLARNDRLDPELARKENSQLREVYSDFTNRFSIRENIEIPCFA